jgi:WD40 repeat protein
MAEMSLDEALARVDRWLGRRRLSHVQELVVRLSWLGGSYQEVAETSGYSAEYLKAVGYKLWKQLSLTLGEKVTCHNLRSILRRYQDQEGSSITTPIAKPCSLATDSQGGALPDLSPCIVRTEELQILQQWIVSDKCRLVGIHGMGGLGKTTLAHQLAKQLHPYFERIIWRTLRYAPSLETLLRDLLQTLSDDIPVASETDMISLLVQALRNQRCLLVLDHGESLLSQGVVTRSYSPGFEGYRDLFEQLIQAAHQSCVVVISREKLRQIGLHEGEFPVRSLLLQGVSPAVGQAIMESHSSLIGSDQDWATLVTTYAGNPLVLKILSLTIQDVFGGSISNFLHYAQPNILALADIHEFLQEQVQRLSVVEIEIMTWLAIRRDPADILDLHEDILSPTSREQLVEGLQSLRRRALIDPVGSNGQFTLQPVLMESMITHLVQSMRGELTTGNLDLFARYALVQAQAKDYVREAQIRLILDPVTQFLLSHWGSLSELAETLNQVLLTLRKRFCLQPHYGGGNLINLLRHLHINLAGYDFSHLTIWQADLRGIPLQQVNFRGADLSRSVFSESLNHFVAVAISPDGNWLATSDFEGEIRLWRMGESQPIFTLRGHVGWVWSMAFSPDSRWLASGGADQTVRIWDLHAWVCLRILKGHTDTVRAVAFSPDGHGLASGSQDHTLKLWDLSTGYCLKTLTGHSNWVWSVAFSPDGRWLASGSQDHSINLWDPISGRCLNTLKGHADAVLSLSFSPDSATLASSSEDQTVRLWNVHSGTLQRLLNGHRDVVWCVAFAPQGEWLVSGSQDQSVKVWDPMTGECVRTLKGHHNEVYSVAFGNASQQSELLMASGSPQSVKVWDVLTGRCSQTLQAYHNGVISSAFILAGSDPSPLLVTGSQDRQVKLWDPITGQCLKVFQGHTDWIWSVAVPPRSCPGRHHIHQLASGSQDQTIRLWDLGTGLCHRVLRGHTHSVLAVAFSRDGQFLASGSADQTIRLWDPLSGHCLRTLLGHQQAVWSVDFSRSTHTLASASQDLTIKLWDILTGQCTATFEGHTSWVWSVAFSPQGHLLASGSRDRTIRIWEVETGQCLQTLSGHTSFVWSVAFSPSGRLLASASEDRTIRIWEVSSGRCLQTLEGHGSWVWSVAFSPQDEHLLVSSSQDETTRLWDLQTGSCVKSLHSEGIYQGMDISETIGLTETQRMTLIALGAIQA